ncbi:MAG: hypothetical protein GY714_15090 [Desulfobacterales bacterium]|nr:hypothetical protein [Desulfobacterales bacterium]
MKHCIVIPFTETVNEKFYYNQGAVEWSFNEVFNVMTPGGKGRDYIRVHGEPNGDELHEVYGDESRIYVMGHGSVGGDRITNGGGLGIDSAALFRYLERAGLRKDEVTFLKLFNCHSAEDGGGVGFSKMMYRILKDNGYDRCRVWGYVGSIYDYDGKNHKMVNDLVRVKDRRREVHGGDELIYR